MKTNYNHKQIIIIIIMGAHIMHSKMKNQYFVLSCLWNICEDLQVYFIFFIEAYVAMELIIKKITFFVYFDNKLAMQCHFNWQDRLVLLYKKKKTFSHVTILFFPDIFFQCQEWKIYNKKCKKIWIYYPQK